MIKLATIKTWPRDRFIGDYFSKQLYGNVAGYKNNRAGASVSTSEGELSRSGAYKMGRLDLEKVQEILSRFLDIIDDPDHTNFVSSGRNGYRNGDKIYRYVLKDALSSIPELEKLLKGRVTSFLNSHYLQPYRLHSAAVWRNAHVPEDIAKTDQPYSLLWHNDHHTTDTVKLFILLSDVTEKDGPLHYLNKKWTKKIIRRGFRDRYNYGVSTTELEDPRYLQKLVGTIGDSLFCNTTICLHRAGIPDPGRIRDIMQFRFEAIRESTQ